MGIPMPPQAPEAGSARAFACEISTSAPPERVWQLWTDVSQWQRWDSGLRAATLGEPFALGARGRIFPDRGPQAVFEVCAFDAGRSYALRIPLPGGSLELARSLRPGPPGQTIFRHEVRFRGLTAGIFARIMGRRYQSLLPGVLESIRQLAEEGA